MKRRRDCDEHVDDRFREASKFEEDRSMSTTALTKIIDVARKVLSPAQLCVICLASTAALFTYTVQTFARADEVKTLRVSILEQSIFDTRAGQCDARKRAEEQDQDDERNEAGRAYGAKLQQLQREYQTETGFPYVLSDCRDL